MRWVYGGAALGNFQSFIRIVLRIVLPLAGSRWYVGKPVDAMWIK
jgi:hypothetical protein